MKQFIIIISLITLSIHCFAQDHDAAKGEISGIIIDSFSKEPVDYASINIFNAGKNTPFNSVSTSNKGHFTIGHLAPGTYNVVVDFIGYQRKRLDNIIVTGNKAKITLGPVLLIPLSKQLQTVTINGRKAIVENKIDKIVYNTANDLSSQGGVALDVLKKVPQVSVDIDGNVEILGNANIRFLINGKPSSIFGASLADALQSIPASQIESIEVISNPGAKYDASGIGGIINIILKDNKLKGINGNINLSGGTRLENGSFNISAHKGKFGVAVFFDGNEQLNSTTLTSLDRRSANSTLDTFSHLVQTGEGALKRTGYQCGINANWNVSAHDEITASFSYNHFGNTNDANINQQENISNENNQPLSSTLSTVNTTSNSTTNSSDISLAYKRTFKKKDQELDVLYNVTNGKDIVDFSQQQYYQTNGYQPNGLQSHNPGKDIESDFSIDYTQPVSDNFTLETGAKLILEDISNSVVTDTLLENGNYTRNTNQSYIFNYTRNIYASYVSATFSLFHKFINGKTGVRYERTEATTDYPNTSIPGYDIWSPSFVLTHKLDKKQSIKCSYSYRIERPDYKDLNPFFNISDPHNISTGNPDLKPEIGHNFEIGYNMTPARGASIYIAAIYRYDSKDIQTYTTFYPTLTIDGNTYSNVSLSQRYNIGSEITTGANIYLSIPVTDACSIRSNMLYADRISNNPGVPQASGFMCRINLNTSYEFPHGLAVELFGNYRSSQKTIQGTRPSFSFYTIALRKQLLNKKLSIGLVMTDPFNKYIDQKTITTVTDYDQTYLRQVPYRSFGLTMNYKFGKLDFKNKEHSDLPQVIEN